MANGTKTIGVVIVNYNAGDHLIACVASVEAEGIAEVVVVDNGSIDSSIDTLAAAYPHVRVLHMDNPGFGAANNRGVKELNTDYIFCINPDTVVHSGAVKVLTDALETAPQVAVVGPRLLNPDGSIYPSARAFPSLVDAVGHSIVGLIRPNNRWTRRYTRVDNDYDVTQTVDWVSGAAMFLRREAFLAVDGFDPKYFLFMEDVDLCWRLHEKGWKVVYEPSAVLTHVGGVTASSQWQRLLAHHRSAVRYNAVTARGPARLLQPLIAAGLWARLPVAWAVGKLRGA